jgi:hypothetical protein
MARRLSLRGYAAHRRRLGLPGGTLHAVQTAREYGRIHVGRDGLVDPVEADRLWAETTDDGKRPPRTAVTRTAPVATSAPALEASRELVGLIAEIERHLSRALRAAVRAAPDAPAGPWEALYREWAKLPEVLERLQGELREPARPVAP